MKTERTDKLYHRYIDQIPELKGMSLPRFTKYLVALKLIELVENGKRYHMAPTMRENESLENFKQEILPLVLAADKLLKTPISMLDQEQRDASLNLMKRGLLTIGVIFSSLPYFIRYWIVMILFLVPGLVAVQTYEYIVVHNNEALAQKWHQEHDKKEDRKPAEAVHMNRNDELSGLIRGALFHAQTGGI